MRDAFICDGIRTPIGRYGGALAGVRADDLAAIPLRELLNRNPRLDPSAIDDVIFGCANQAGEDNRNVAHMATLLAGYPHSVAGTTINRLCGSGLDAIGFAARTIKAGDADLLIAGGVESMSRAPFVMGKATAPFQRQAEMFDTTIGWRFVNPLMQQQFGTDSMPETAENVAELLNISREDQDAFAYRSQQRTAKAQCDGILAQEIVPVQIIGKKGAVSAVREDEHPRAETTLEQLAQLKTPFRKNGVVTAGNASGVNDGAAAMIVASEQHIKAQGLTPRARIVAMATMRARGVSPWAFMCCSLATIIAAAPSFTPEALPAVTTPFLRNGVFSCASCSSVVSARGCSSSRTALTAPFLPMICTGTISCARMPSHWAFAVRCWLRYAKASWSSRLIFNNSATFSAVSGMLSVPNCCCMSGFTKRQPMVVSNISA